MTCSVKARCPECDEEVTIVPTGVTHHPDKPSTYWQVAEHPRGEKSCAGSWRLV